MALMSMFQSKPAQPEGGPLDPSWVRTEKGRFFRLLDLDPAQAGIAGVGGVFVIWHRGIRPEWVYAGASDDLGEALTKAAEDEEILSYEVHGGLSCTWAPIRKEYRPGVVRYLREVLRTVVSARAGDGIDETSVEPIAVKSPG
jgi:hypothetical protein